MWDTYNHSSQRVDVSVNTNVKTASAQFFNKDVLHSECLSLLDTLDELIDICNKSLEWREGKTIFQIMYPHVSKAIKDNNFVVKWNDPTPIIPKFESCSGCAITHAEEKLNDYKAARVRIERIISIIKFAEGSVSVDMIDSRTLKLLLDPTSLKSNYEKNPELYDDEAEILDRIHKLQNLDSTDELYLHGRLYVHYTHKYANEIEADKVRKRLEPSREENKSTTTNKVEEKESITGSAFAAFVIGAVIAAIAFAVMS